MNRNFRPRSTTPRPSPEEAARQGRVSRVAFEALRTRDATVAFLNTHHDGLGARPLDLALRSDEGLAAVELVLAEHRPD